MPALLIVGLPGSGKTHLAHEIMRQRPDWILVDDIKDQGELPPGDVLGVVIIDPRFCDPDILNMALSRCQSLYGSVEILWFANDPLRCRANVALRQDGRQVNGMISWLAKRYVIPQGATVLPVWTPTSTDLIKNNH